VTPVTINGQCRANTCNEQIIPVVGRPPLGAGARGFAGFVTAAGLAFRAAGFALGAAAFALGAAAFALGAFSAFALGAFSAFALGAGGLGGGRAAAFGRQAAGTTHIPLRAVGSGYKLRLGCCRLLYSDGNSIIRSGSDDSE